jgi:cysteine desulfurase
VFRAYFDYNATTPLSPEVLEQLVPALSEVYGNASSIHQTGQQAKQKLEAARRQVAEFLGCSSKEVVFTGGGTESNNLSIFGPVRNHTASRKHVITTAIEHPSVLKACAQLERDGVEVTYVRVGSSGVVDPADVRKAIRPDTVLITVMHVNNETGAVQPVREIAEIANDADVLIHIDGVQAAGRVPIDVHALDVDLYSISGHKMQAPKGIGALYIRKGVKIEAMLHGGRQENGVRAGTENVPSAIALGCAAEWLSRNQTELMMHVSELRDRLEQGVVGRVANTSVNCSRSMRVPNTTNIRFNGIDGEPLLISLDLRGFSVSSGSACSSGAVEPSHVLTAMGLSKEEARSCLRFSLGRGNTVEEVDRLIEAIVESVAKLRRISPARSAHV